MKLIGCIVGIVSVGVFFAAVAGFYWFKTTSDKEEASVEMRAVCGASAPCIAAVSAHFEACYSESYVFMSGVSRPVFELCINRQAGSHVFPP